MTTKQDNKRSKNALYLQCYKGTRCLEFKMVVCVLQVPLLIKTYNKYGESQDCKNGGKGGLLANQVYRFPGRKGKFLFCDITEENPTTTE